MAIAPLRVLAASNSASISSMSFPIALAVGIKSSTSSQSPCVVAFSLRRFIRSHTGAGFTTTTRGIALSRARGCISGRVLGSLLRLPTTSQPFLPAANLNPAARNAVAARSACSTRTKTASVLTPMASPPRATTVECSRRLIASSTRRPTGRYPSVRSFTPCFTARNPGPTCLRNPPFAFASFSSRKQLAICLRFLPLLAIP